MAYRNNLVALAARKRALDVEVADRTRERDEAARMLEEAQARAKELVFENLRIASPCNVPWSSMTGDDRVRTCAQCDKQVFDLSSMTRAEAETLIAANNGRLCATYFQRSDGTILLADCEVGRSRKRRLRVVVAGIAAAASISGFAAVERGTRVAGAMDTGRADAAGRRRTFPAEPRPYLPAECVSLRERIFAFDDCVGPELRARLRVLFIDVAQPFATFSEAAGTAEECKAVWPVVVALEEICKR